MKAGGGTGRPNHAVASIAEAGKQNPTPSIASVSSSPPSVTTASASTVSSRLRASLGRRNRSGSPNTKSTTIPGSVSGNSVGSRASAKATSARSGIVLPTRGTARATGSHSNADTLKSAGPVIPVPSSPPPCVLSPSGSASSGRSGLAASPSSLGPPVDSSFVHVVARIRPPLPGEHNSEQGIDVQSDRRTLLVHDELTSRKRCFIVDQVIDSRGDTGSQAAFFDQVGANIIQQTLGGYNICVLAYGHTGSGKTYTMLGSGKAFVPGISGDGAGLLPRFLQELETQFSSNASDEVHYTCEFIEIYNERIRDLLAPPSEVGHDRQRVVHVHPKYGVKIDGLQPSVVTSIEQVMQLIDFGNQMRMVSTTTMNQRSSRSHAVFTFSVECLDKSPSSSNSSPLVRARTTRKSTVTFVDLAGREDQTVSINRALQFKEMIFINTSLFHLANVISKLADGGIKPGSLADFRNSKLTLLLSPALIGNSRTTLIATLSPLAELYEDTCSTLAFAQTAKKIRTKPVVNNLGPLNVAVELEEEVKSLRQELADVKTDSSEKDQQLRTAEALISHYRSSWEEARQYSIELQNARVAAAKQLGLSWQDASPMVPFLTNLSSDPSLQGVCNYFFESSLLIGSDPKACGMLLQGVGIAPRMCELQRGANHEVTIQLCDSVDDAPRVLVNGVALLPGQVQKLSDKDCFIFGYSHSFRLLIPGSSTSDDAFTSVHNVDLDIASAIEEVHDTEGTQFKSALPFLQQLGTRVSQNVLQAFVHALHRICPLVDEANLITRELRGSDGLRFELNVLTDLFDYSNDKPELVVCVVWNPQVLDSHRSRVANIMRQFRMRRRNSGASSVEGLSSDRPRAPSSASDVGGGRVRRLSSFNVASYPWTPLVQEMGLEDQMCVGDEGELLLYVWALEKFLGRLRDIRELYEEGFVADAGGFEFIRKLLYEHPDFDPWHEASFAGVQLLLDGFATGAEPVATVSSSPKRSEVHRKSFTSVIQSVISAAATGAASDDGDAQRLNPKRLQALEEKSDNSDDEEQGLWRWQPTGPMSERSSPAKQPNGLSTPVSHTREGREASPEQASKAPNRSLDFDMLEIPLQQAANIAKQLANQTNTSQPPRPSSQVAIGSAPSASGQGLLGGRSSPATLPKSSVSGVLAAQTANYQLTAENSAQRAELVRVTNQRDRLLDLVTEVVKAVEKGEAIELNRLTDSVQQISPDWSSRSPVLPRRGHVALAANPPRAVIPTTAIQMPRNSLSVGRSTSNPRSSEAQFSQPSTGMSVPAPLTTTTSEAQLRSIRSAFTEAATPSQPIPATVAQASATSVRSDSLSNRRARSQSPQDARQQLWKMDTIAAIPPAVSTAMLVNHYCSGQPSRLSWPRQQTPPVYHPALQLKPGA